MTARIRNRHNEFQFKKLIVPMVVMLAFWGVAMWGFIASGLAMPLIMFGYIGTALGVGLGLYGSLPKKQKPIGRRLTLFLVGLFLIVFAIVQTPVAFFQFLLHLFDHEGRLGYLHRPYGIHRPQLPFLRLAPLLVAGYWLLVDG